MYLDLSLYLDGRLSVCMWGLHVVVVFIVFIIVVVEFIVVFVVFIELIFIIICLSQEPLDSLRNDLILRHKIETHRRMQHTL